MIEILPAILEKDWTNITRRVKQIQAFSQRAHLDVMDGQFVGNVSFNDTAKISEIPLELEAHLMILRPELHLMAWNIPNIFRIVVHAEAVQNLGMALSMIKAMGKEAGVAINPHTPVHDVVEYLSQCDLVMVMGVDPGHSGQKFQYDVLEKVKEMRALEPTLNISVDGGVNEYTSKHILTAGASTIVANSYLFSSADPEEAYRALQALGAESHSDNAGQ
jgi:ribulose-phosphate 3-epimerase